MGLGRIHHEVNRGILTDHALCSLKLAKGVNLWKKEWIISDKILTLYEINENLVNLQV